MAMLHFLIMCRHPIADATLEQVRNLPARLRRPVLRGHHRHNKDSGTWAEPDDA
ncbi:MAG: hypothetical protein MZV63_01880 [Marinilabiliales bacterium]|nr:hypothetical protein [Marinilabiliales bacterium]